jgi:hypothetical protein
MDKKAVCNRKRLYDTEFEATVIASRKEKEWGVELKIYPCGKHWHIANKDRRLRNQHIKKHGDKSYCDLCDSPMRPKHWKTHITRPGHLAKLYRKERGGG